MRMFAMTAIALVLAAPAALAQDRPPTEAPAAAAELPSPVRLVAADAVVGKPVRASGGESAGTAAYLTVDSETGAIQHLLVDAAGGEGMIAVPWSAVRAENGGDLTVSVPRERIEGAPRVPESRLAELTQPKLRTEVWRYYAQPPAVRADERRSESVVEPRTPDTARAAEPAPMAREQVGDGGPFILLGRQLVRTVAPPSVTTATDLEGKEVEAEDEALGDIATVMLDAEAGRVAYVVIERPGGGKARVPFETLRWDRDGGFALEIAGKRPDRLPEIAEAEVADPLDPAGMANLYRDFGVAPYWR